MSVWENECSGRVEGERGWEGEVSGGERKIGEREIGERKQEGKEMIGNLQCS